jgi:uncharacterized protein (DUF2249 family)
MITAATNVGALLEAHPDLVEFLASYHPRFGRLRNRLLRRVMAPRVTLADAARIAGIDPHVLVEAVRRAAGETAPASPAPAAPAWEPAPMPAALTAIAADARTELDVRDDIARGQEPFERIMTAVRALPAGHVLVLRAPFEPVPLYDVLGRRGFAHWTERRAADDWAVSFWREAAAPAPVATSTETTAARPGPTIDVRGLPPPQPMVLVLERLDTLGADETLEVLHERRPLFLYPQLDERGFSHETDEPSPGLVRIRIRRAPERR